MIPEPSYDIALMKRVLPHSPAYQPGVHYVSAPVGQLADAILYYVQHEEERLRIVENAYHFATQEMQFGKSVKIIMAAVHKTRAALTYRQDAKSINLPPPRCHAKS